MGVQTARERGSSKQYKCNINSEGLGIYLLFFLLEAKLQSSLAISHPKMYLEFSREVFYFSDVHHSIDLPTAILAVDISGEYHEPTYILLRHENYLLNVCADAGEQGGGTGFSR